MGLPVAEKRQWPLGRCVLTTGCSEREAAKGGSPDVEAEASAFEERVLYQEAPLAATIWTP